MKSHFQRSEGLDACIQVRAETGRANAIVVSAGVGRVGGHRAGELRANLGAALIGDRGAKRQADVGQDLPVFLRFSGRRHGARRCLQPAVLVDVGGVLLDPRCARQNDVSRLGQLRQQHALHDEQWQTAGFLAAITQDTSPIDPSGPGSKT